jgi:hypothetical protein
MDEIVAFVMGNFTLTFLVIGAACSLAGIARSPRPLAAPVVVEKFFFWFLFFSIGCSFLYNGFFHTVMPEMAAKLIGWANSPFQIELGFASIGFGLVGVIAPWKSIQMRFAAILPVACFLWGAAGVHIQSMITERNFAPGNAGVIFWTDLLLPLIGLAFLWLQNRYENEGRSAAP